MIYTSYFAKLKSLPDDVIPILNMLNVNDVVL